MDNKNAIKLCIASGILLSMAWLIPCLYFCVFAAFIPLFILEEKLHKNNYELRLYSFLSFFIWNLISCWWIAEAHLLGMFIIVIINSLLLSIVFSVSNYISTKHKIDFTILFVVFMLCFEYFNSQWELQFPWLNLGNALAYKQQIIQWYQYTGTSGGSLWILIINICLFKAYILIDKRKKLIFTFVLLTIITLPVVISLVIFNKPIKASGIKSFSLIQSMIDPYEDKFREKSLNKNSDNFLYTIDSICQLGVDIIIGPETQILEPIDEDLSNESRDYNRLLTISKKYPNTDFIIGCHSKIYTENNTDYLLYNSALYMSSKIKSQFYHKAKLVPLFEKIPFVGMLPFLKNMQISIAGSSTIYDSKQEITKFTTSTGEYIIPLICFESVFSEYTSKKITDNEPSFINIIVNDGWWKNSYGYLYHLNLCKIRAIENRKEVLRTANTGISAHIDAKGTIVAKTKWWHKEILNGSVKLYKKRSFYCKYGDYLGLIFSIIAAILITLDLIIKKAKNE